MNRTIKFRAWENGQMRHDFWSRCDLGNYLDSVGIFSDVKIMQFTGLLDKNGKEIYEGDIVEFEYGDDAAFVNAREEVVFALGQFGFWGEPLRNFSSQTSVIGNKFESPELLTTKG